MFELVTSEALVAFFQVVMIDLVLAGDNAIVIGLAAAGLPVGIQIIGPYLEDRTPIDIAKRMASVVGGYAPPKLG